MNWKDWMKHTSVTREQRVKLNHPDNHPLVIGVGKNTRMNRWEITAQIGNFDSKLEASRGAAKVKEMLERELKLVVDSEVPRR